ncbi:MAG: hypothetical protein Q8N58_00505 [bacterium]|nr:hypothetical protein [bacterium]
MRKLLLIIFLSLLFFNSFSVPVLAQEDRGLVPCDLTGENRCTFCDLFIMFDNIVDFLLLRIVPILTAAMIAVGGFMYVISQGKPETLSKVKSLFTNIVIGLAIIYGAWAIVNTFLMIIGVQGWTGLREGWWQINCQ